MLSSWLQYRNGSQTGQAAREPARTTPQRPRQLGQGAGSINLVRCWPCNLKEKLLHFPLRRRERMSSVLKKRRKKMRKHKYKKLRRRQKFERRKS